MVNLNSPVTDEHIEREPGIYAAAGALRRRDSRCRQSTVTPLHAYLEAASSTQSRDAAGRPQSWQRRQQFDRASVRLKQHFTNGGDGAEVAVDLKHRQQVCSLRWMQIEQADLRALLI